ncbi:hypothetical protein COOONC_24349 [Cooperia oncophora]
MSTTAVADEVEKATQFVLNSLSENGNELNTLQISKDLGVDHQAVIGAIKSLLTHEGQIDYPVSGFYAAGR